jgi:hypothetical protein
MLASHRSKNAMVRGVFGDSPKIAKLTLFLAEVYFTWQLKYTSPEMGCFFNDMFNPFNSF